MLYIRYAVAILFLVSTINIAKAESSYDLLTHTITNSFKLNLHNDNQAIHHDGAIVAQGQYNQSISHNIAKGLKVKLNLNGKDNLFTINNIIQKIILY